MPKARRLQTATFAVATLLLAGGLPALASTNDPPAGTPERAVLRLRGLGTHDCQGPHSRQGQDPRQEGHEAGDPTHAAPGASRLHLDPPEQSADQPFRSGPPTGSRRLPRRPATACSPREGGAADAHGRGSARGQAYSGNLNFVFGEASLGGRVAAIYLPRLRPEFYDLESDEIGF